MAMKENTRKVFDYLKDNTDKDLTAADVAEGEADGTEVPLEPK